jgi:2-polyprenyl-3-methyl-5-hydroxy-6-metoxy-1,4-benzoquinol methylase
MNSLQAVRSYFDRAARRFDAIYEGDKPLTQRVVDRLFRRVVLERFELICNLAPLPGAFSVLDVGCGPGRYSVALAKAGAARVVGVDVAAAMIRLALEESARSGVAERCEFVESGFLDFASDEVFDVVIATGYFDYTEDPLPHARRMAAACRGRIYASFPKRWEWRVPIRRLRFLLAGGYVRFYSHAEVRSLWDAAGLANGRVSVLDLGRDYLVVARAG